MFQHTAARRRLEAIQDRQCRPVCFNTQPPEGGWQRFVGNFLQAHGFNTQPPEGGWADGAKAMVYDILFQHTAARRRLASFYNKSSIKLLGFNTQPPEGGWLKNDSKLRIAYVSTHSRPKAAGRTG